MESEAPSSSAPTAANKGRFRRNRHEGEIDPAFKRAPTEPAPTEEGDRQPISRQEATAAEDQSLLPRDKKRSPRDDFGLNLPQFRDHEDDEEENKPLIEAKPQQVEGIDLGHIPQREVPPREESNHRDNSNNDNNNNNNSNSNNKANESNEKPYKRRFFSFRGQPSNSAEANKSKGNEDAENSADGKPKSSKKTATNNNNNNNTNTANNNTTPATNNAAVSKSDIPKYFRRIQYIRNVQETFPVNLFYSLSRWMQLGYDTLPFQRLISFATAYPAFDLRQYSQGWGVSVTCKSIHTYKKHVVGLVKPFVRIHVVYLDTGLYVKSSGEPPIRPVYTSPTLSIDSGSSATWWEEVLLDAEYADIVSENSVVLFELIDERPNLSLGGTIFRNRKLFHYKKIAWGYLLPIGMDGGLNVGLGNRKKEHGHLSLSANNRDAAAAAAAAASGGGGGGGEHIHFDLPDNNKDGDVVEQSPLVPDLELSRLSAEQHSNPNNSNNNSNNNTDLHLRIQLYQYQEYEGLVGFTQRHILTWSDPRVEYSSPEEANYPDNVPAIFLQWRKLYKQAIPGAFLKIAIGSRIRKTPKHEDEDVEKKGNHPEDDEEDDNNAPPTSRSKKTDKTPTSKAKGKKRRKRPKTLEERAKLRAAVMRRSRGAKDACVVPDKFLNRLEVGPEGSLVLAFACSGHLLAIASKMTSYHYPLSSSEVIYAIRLYDTDLDEEVWVEEAAHHAVIFDLKWTKNDRYLISAAGDGTCKVWDFLALSPTVQQYNLAYNSYVTQSKAMQSIMGGDDDHHMMTNRTANTHNSTVHLHADADVYISPQSLLKLYPPTVKHVCSLAAGISGYAAVFQDFVTPVPAVGSYNVFSKATYDISYWAEQLNTIRGYQVPRVIVGCSDGRIRVFDSNKFMGFVVVAGKSDDGNTQDFSPHDGVVNSVVIDDRSKYLITADSYGEILAWRLDAHGWYQLLRKFKRDTGPASHNSAAMSDVFDSGSVLSLAMHPEKLKGLMLVLSRQPALLRVLNMSTYKPLSYCEGFNGITSHIVREGEEAVSTGIFHRASFSADGKYIICCSNDNQNKQLFRISIWETFTGHQVPSPISKITFPYPVRCVAWHPAQHLIAVAMVGEGAAVNLYCGEQESASDLAERSAQFSAFAASLPFVRSHADSNNTFNDDIMRRSTNSVSSELSHDTTNNKELSLNNPSAKIALPTIVENSSTKEANNSIEQELDDRNKRNERSKALLAKIRASKGK